MKLVKTEDKIGLLHLQGGNPTCGVVVISNLSVYDLCVFHTLVFSEINNC